MAGLVGCNDHIRYTADLGDNHCCYGDAIGDEECNFCFHDVGLYDGYSVPDFPVALSYTRIPCALACDSSSKALVGELVRLKA